MDMNTRTKLVRRLFADPEISIDPCEVEGFEADRFMDLYLQSDTKGLELEEAFELEVLYNAFCEGCWKIDPCALIKNPVRLRQGGNYYLPYWHPDYEERLRLRLEHGLNPDPSFREGTPLSEMLKAHYESMEYYWAGP